MVHLKLTDDLLTNIEEIDSQHRELFARGNLFLFPENGKPTDKDMAGALHFLKDYVNEHFAAEERLMEYYDYGRLEGHRKQHQRLRNEVAEIYRRSNKKNGFHEALASELYFLLNDWYVYHIKEWDKAYAVFLKDVLDLDQILVPKLEKIDVSGVELLDSGDGLTSAQLQTLKKLRNI